MEVGAEYYFLLFNFLFVFLFYFCIINMKSFGFTCSILKDTNRVISASDCDWSKVAEGSFFKLSKDRTFFTVLKSQSIFLNYDFEVKDPRRIIIKKDIGINLSEHDTLKIIYKEYELLTVMSIVKPGKGYKKDDIIYLQGGIPVIDKTDNIKKTTSLIVSEVDESGGIKNISLKDKGLYTEFPRTICNVFGGSGDFAELETEFQVTDNKTIIDRGIVRIDYSPQISELYLDYALSEGIKKGRISCNKWEILLSGNYLDKTQRNAEYEINRDFTPYLKMPLLSKNSFQQDIVFNTSLMILENKIKELEERLARLS